MIGILLTASLNFKSNILCVCVRWGEGGGVVVRACCSCSRWGRGQFSISSVPALSFTFPFILFYIFFLSSTSSSVSFLPFSGR